MLSFGSILFRLLPALLSLAQRGVEWGEQNQLLTAGRAQEARANLENINVIVAAAIVARNSTDTSPTGVSNDPFNTDTHSTERNLPDD